MGQMRGFTKAGFYNSEPKLHDLNTYSYSQSFQIVESSPFLSLSRIKCLPRLTPTENENFAKCEKNIHTRDSSSKLAEVVEITESSAFTLRSTHVTKRTCGRLMCTCPYQPWGSRGSPCADVQLGVVRRPGRKVDMEPSAPRNIH
eukprot:5341071-Amphidinium_carterae.1